MKVTVAKIVDNIPYCPNCNCQLGQITKNYCEVIKEGEKYTQFERRCNKCGKKFKYQTNAEFEETKRYAFDEIMEIKEGD